MMIFLLFYRFIFWCFLMVCNECLQVLRVENRKNDLLEVKLFSKFVSKILKGSIFIIEFGNSIVFYVLIKMFRIYNYFKYIN